MKQRHIFGSLGSSYQLQDAINALSSLFNPNLQAKQTLVGLLKQAFPNYSAYPTYKGRDALEIALKSLGVGVGDLVLTQAFSCYSVEEAILRCNAKPVYFDIIKEGLRPSIDSLNQAVQSVQSDGQPTQIKAIIAQFTLGTVDYAEEIEAWAKSADIPMIADLAQALGSTKANGELLGTGASAIVLSAGRDKVWDAVSGGVVLLRENTTARGLPRLSVEFMQTLKDSLYPLVSWLIRKTYPFGLGKLLHFLCTTFGILRSPIESIYPKAAQMSDSLATFALERWGEINPTSDHRRIIAHRYLELLGARSLTTQQNVELGSNLRFPVYCDNIELTLARFKAHHIHLSDRWYRQVVDSGSSSKKTLYQAGQCPNAEYLAKHCLNLPTHIDISLDDVQQLVELLK